MTETTIKFVDLFAGIGGFHQALELVNTRNNNCYDFKCVFVSEIDKEAIETYSTNFSYSKEEIIDIKDISPKKIPNHNFLFAGFPCQTFSNAGKKEGFLDGIKGRLFFDIIEILKVKKPKYILLENVKHLVNHDNGDTWKKITGELIELGYIIPDPEKPLLLSPHEFGIPQERQRVFIPGVLKEKNTTEDNYINIDLSSLKTDILSNSNLKEAKKYIWEKYLNEPVDQKYFLNKNEEKDNYLIKVLEAWDVFYQNVKKPKGRTLPVIWVDEFDEKHRNSSLEGLSDWRKKYISDMRSVYNKNQEFIDQWLTDYDVNSWNKREKKFEWQAGKDVKSIKDSFIQLRQSGIRCKRPTKFPTLVAMVQIPLIYDRKNKGWRQLSPRETAKLQSFPTDYKIYSDIKENNKDFYSYKQFGNSVNVDVVSYIQEYLLKHY